MKNFKSIKNIFKKSFFSLILMVLGLALGYFINIYLGRTLGKDGIGVYYFIMSFINIGLIFSKFGLNISLIKISAIGKKEILDFKLLKNSICIVLLTSLFSIILIFLLFSFSRENLSNFKLLKIVILSIFPLTVLSIFSSILIGGGKILSATLIQSLLFNLIFLILILYFKSDNISNVLMFFLISSYIVLVVAGYLFFKIFRKKIDYENNTEVSIKKILKTSYPLMFISSINILLTSLDKIMLGIWHTSGVVGIYGASQKLVAISSMGLIAINNVVAPIFAREYSNGNIIELKRIVKIITIVMSLIASLFLLIFLKFSQELLNIFGRGFTGTNTLKILSVGQFFVLATGPMAYLLMMTGNDKFHRKNLIISLIINILLNFILIPKYAGEGAAIATAIALIIKNLLGFIYVKKIFKNEIEKKES